MGTDKTKEQLFRRYYQYLRLEKSFSDNTVEAYQRDLRKFVEFAEANGVELLSPELNDFHQFSAILIDLGINPLSLSRILSGVRSFYRFLWMTGEIDDDPTELLEFPQRPKHFPDVLSAEEVDSIISVIDLTQSEGQRNKTMIEVLFSCGLRVSELCSLKLSDLYLEEGFVRVLGKGSKQRLVPISQRAIDELRLYFQDRSTIAVKPGYEDFVFLSRLRKTSLSRIMVFHMIKEYVELAGIQKTVSPHTFRHSFATCLLEGGANLRAIQAMLGHESINTTEMYMHLDTTHLREELLNHHPRYMRRKNN